MHIPVGWWNEAFSPLPSFDPSLEPAKVMVITAGEREKEYTEEKRKEKTRKKNERVYNQATQTCNIKALA